MSLSPTLDGDVTLIEGTLLASALSRPDKEFLGLYAFTPEDGVYIRGARSWITAKGASLNKLNGVQLVEAEKIFIDTFDRLDSLGVLPTLEQVATGSTTGNPASWDSQQTK